MFYISYRGTCLGLKVANFERTWRDSLVRIVYIIHDHLHGFLCKQEFDGKLFNSTFDTFSLIFFELIRFS